MPINISENIPDESQAVQLPINYGALSASISQLYSNPILAPFGAWAQNQLNVYVDNWQNVLQSINNAYGNATTGLRDSAIAQGALSYATNLLNGVAGNIQSLLGPLLQYQEFTQQLAENKREFNLTNQEQQQAMSNAAADQDIQGNLNAVGAAGNDPVFANALGMNNAGNALTLQGQAQMQLQNNQAQNQSALSAQEAQQAQQLQAQNAAQQSAELNQAGLINNPNSPANQAMQAQANQNLQNLINQAGANAGPGAQYVLVNGQYYANPDYNPNPGATSGGALPGTPSGTTGTGIDYQELQPVINPDGSISYPSETQNLLTVPNQNNNTGGTSQNTGAVSTPATIAAAMGGGATGNASTAGNAGAALAAYPTLGSGSPAAVANAAGAAPVQTAANPATYTPSYTSWSNPYPGTISTGQPTQTTQTAQNLPSLTATGTGSQAVGGGFTDDSEDDSEDSG